MDDKTAGRTVEIFEAFAEFRQQLSLTEIGRALGAPMTRCLYLIRGSKIAAMVISGGCAAADLSDSKAVQEAAQLADQAAV